MRGGWNGKLLFNRYKIQVGKKKVLEWVMVIMQQNLNVLNAAQLYT